MRLKLIKGILLTVLLIGVLTLTFNVQPVEAADDWPMFRHDLSHSGYSTSTAPDTNNTIWTYTTGYWVVSSPAVVDGKVYIGSRDNKTYCVNALTGTHMWNYTTGSLVYSSPTVADGKVYIGSADCNVYCFGQLPVGGVWVPVDKFALLAPYIGLTILLAVAVIAAVYVRKRKRNTEINSFTNNQRTS